MGTERETESKAPPAPAASRATRKVERDRYAEATKELELWFAAHDGILGMRGVGCEPGESKVWDAERCAALHYAMVVRSLFAPDPRKLREIEPRVRKMPRVHWETACVVFTPHGWPVDLAGEMSRGARGGSLVGLLIGSTRLREAYLEREIGRLRAAHRDHVRRGYFWRARELAVTQIEPTMLDLLAFAASEAERRKEGSSGQARVRRFFEPLRREAEARLAPALAAYEEIRRSDRRAAVEESRGVFA